MYELENAKLPWPMCGEMLAALCNAGGGGSFSQKINYMCPEIVFFLDRDLTRYLTKQKPHMAGGQGSHWLIKNPVIIHLCVTHPSEIFAYFLTYSYC